MDIVRWGIIGCGDVTETKSGPALQKVEGSELVAVMRRNGDLAADYARRHGVPRWTDAAAELIADPEVNAVYVATPPAFHKEYTLMAAAAGKPVYVEKPMAMDYGECLEMIAACEAAGVALFVAYYRRRLPRFMLVERLLREGLIGEVRAVIVRLLRQPLEPPYPHDQAPWRLVPEIAGGGLFVDLGAHTLDYLDHVLGPIARVSGYAANQGGHYDAEDTVSAAFAFESGAQGTGTWCFCAHTPEDSVELVGTEGSLRFSTFGAEPIQLVSPNGSRGYRCAMPPHVQQPLIQSVVDDLRGVGTCPSTGVSAARTSWVMDQILKQYRAQVG